MGWVTQFRINKYKAYLYRRVFLLPVKTVEFLSASPAVHRRKEDPLTPVVECLDPS